MANCIKSLSSIPRSVGESGNVPLVVTVIRARCGMNTGAIEGTDEAGLYAQWLIPCAASPMKWSPRYNNKEKEQAFPPENASKGCQSCRAILLVYRHPCGASHRWRSRFEELPDWLARCDPHKEQPVSGAANCRSADFDPVCGVGWYV